MFKHETDVSDFLTDEQLDLASGGFDHTATDPTNPLCPEPRPRPWVGNHKG